MALPTEATLSSDNPRYYLEDTDKLLKALRAAKCNSLHLKHYQAQRQQFWEVWEFEQHSSYERDDLRLIQEIAAFNVRLAKHWHKLTGGAS